ncbi:MAG: hypothetical protein E7377_02275 [Clostridiales bacterium]|nr:hypothetical protein [Clostridiales bacterium]
MEKNAHKQMEEALAEIYRNAQLALTSISDILPEVGNDEEIKQELHAQHEAYEHFSSRASMLARDMGLELKEPNPMKKVMMWGSIKMSTMTNNSRSHIADMMLQGTVMGISALRTTVGDISPDGDERIRSLLDEMIKKEEEFEERWKTFL